MDLGSLVLESLFLTLNPWVSLHNLTLNLTQSQVLLTALIPREEFDSPLLVLMSTHQVWPQG